MTDPLLAERIAVVTGAGQGIGREIARSMRSYGAEVDGTGMACDVTSEEQVRAVVSDTMVAGAVVFLASDLASYITGTVIEAGGGRYI
jgi:NAD(P)-dependent dehydrogenase (short-subunit alcohol dehydrogenase family)